MFFDQINSFSLVSNQKCFYDDLFKNVFYNASFFVSLSVSKTFFLLLQIIIGYKNELTSLIWD